jgi:hypothetical protein
MPRFVAEIRKTVSNGPYAYSFGLESTSGDVTTQDVVNNVATAALALDGIKAKVGALGGSLLHANVSGETA